MSECCDKAAWDAAEKMRIAVRAWAAANEIAEPPLDWFGLGVILNCHPEENPW